MLIGILQTGKVGPELAGAHGQYPEMFERLLRRVDPGLAFRTHGVVDGDIPDPTAADGWLITGSRHGVYDDLPWIAPLKAMLRGARAAGRPIVGVCFGHQILAEAFGGRVEKASAGWGCGVHRYEVLARPGWMAEAPAVAAWHAMHQDQVTGIPADATLLATSAFCPNAMLAYGDPEAPDAISVQAHPEFDEAYSRILVETRRGTVIPEATADAALAGFGAPVDADAFARWAVRFLRARQTGRAAA